MKINRFVPIVIAVILTLIVFWQFFLKGYIPMPANFMVSWYEPWKSDTSKNGVSTIAHKAVGDDIFRQIIPFKKIAIERLAEWSFPLWNPYGGSGQPLLANLHPGYLNPFSVLLLLPTHIGWSWFVILQLPLLFLAVYWYARRIYQSRIGSIISASCLVFSGIAVTRYIYGDYIWALITLPILLGLIELYRTDDWKGIFIGFPLIIAFLFVSVQPQISIYILLFVVLYACVRVPKKIVSLLLFVGFGFGFASIQLIPTFEFIQHANITAASSSFIFSKFLMPVSHLVTLIIPNYFGNVGTYNFWGTTDYVETVVSMGSIPIFLAFLAIQDKKKNHLVLFFGWSILVTILCTLDWFGTRLLYGLPMPVLSTSIPTRIYILTTFFISILTGFGADYSIKHGIHKKFIFIFWMVLLAIAGVTIFGYIRPLSCPVTLPLCRSVAMRTTMMELGVFSLFTLVLYMRSKQYISVSLLLLIVSIGWYNSQKFLPMSPAKYFMPIHPLFATLRTHTDTRVHSVGSAVLATDLSTYYGFFDPNYYDPLYIRRYGELIAYANTGSHESSLSRSDIEISRDEALPQDKHYLRERLLNILSVGMILAPLQSKYPGESIVWKDEYRKLISRPDGLPRAYMVYDYKVQPDDRQILSLVFSPTFNIKNEVILEEDPRVFMGSVSQENISTTGIDRYTSNNILIHTRSEQDGILILTDTYYPGWNAYVDGIKTKLYRANYAFRGVVVPKGLHDVEFIYEPAIFRIGAWVTGISFVIYVVFLWVVRRKRP